MLIRVKFFSELIQIISMSIGFFYNELDWINENIIKHLRGHRIHVEAIDINKFILDIHNKDAFKHKLYINRVYPSSNIHSYNNLRFMLEVIRHIENLGIPVINCFDSAYADYSKTEANNILEKFNIPTAQTLLFSNPVIAKRAAKVLTFPRIIKMDAGGRARNVYKVNTPNQYLKVVNRLNRKHHLIHVEKFYKASKGFSTRLFVLNYKCISASKKFLLRGWLGNPARGSTSDLYPDVPKKVCRLGERVARITKTRILGLDIVETEETPVVIDINSTPVFHEGFVKKYGYDPSKMIADFISSEYEKNNA